MDQGQQRFLDDFENALTFLSKDNNINNLEKVVNNFVVSSQCSHDTQSFINFQLVTYQLLGEHSNPINHYLKADIQVDYSGRYKEAFRRLYNLKQISNIHIINAENAMTYPERLNTTLFTYNDTRPHELNMLLINNDRKSIRTSFDINGGLNLLNNLTTNLIEKLQKGNNDIDKDTIVQFRNTSNDLNNLLDDIINQNEK